MRVGQTGRERGGDLPAVIQPDRHVDHCPDKMSYPLHQANNRVPSSRIGPGILANQTVSGIDASSK